MNRHFHRTGKRLAPRDRAPVVEHAINSGTIERIFRTWRTAPDPGTMREHEGATAGKIDSTGLICGTIK
jgi:hypothetical protein